MPTIEQAEPPLLRDRSMISMRLQVVAFVRISQQQDGSAGRTRLLAYRRRLRCMDDERSPIGTRQQDRWSDRLWFIRIHQRLKGAIKGGGGLWINRTKAFADDAEVGPKRSLRSGIHPQYFGIAVKQDHCSSALLISATGARRASVHRGQTPPSRRWASSERH